MRRGWALTSAQDGWVLEVRDRRGRRARVLGYDFGVHASSAHRLLADKAACSDALARALTPAVPHAMAHPDPRDPQSWFAALTSRLALEFPDGYVIKPNEGTGGQGVQRWLPGRPAPVFFPGPAAWAPYVPGAREMRVIMAGEKIWACYEKLRPAVTGDGSSPLGALARAAWGPKSAALVERAAADGLIPGPGHVPAAGERVELDWRHNLGLGAAPVPVADSSLDRACRLLARRARGALGFWAASVDVMADASGRLAVLEVNGGVMVEAYAASSPEAAARCDALYDALLRRAMGFQSRP